MIQIRIIIVSFLTLTAVIGCSVEGTDDEAANEPDGDVQRPSDGGEGLPGFLIPLQKEVTYDFSQNGIVLITAEEGTAGASIIDDENIRIFVFFLPEEVHESLILAAGEITADDLKTHGTKAAAFRPQADGSFMEAVPYNATSPTAIVLVAGNRDEFDLTGILHP